MSFFIDNISNLQLSSSFEGFARIGAFCAPFLIDGNTSLMNIGLLMMVIHLITAFCAYKLPETKGRNLGDVVDREEEEVERVNESDSTPYSQVQEVGNSMELI